MNYAAAQALADSTLAALRVSSEPGKDTPDATTTVYRTVYHGPRGKGWEVRVKLKGKVNDIEIVRHVGGETHRNKPDPTIALEKAKALSTIAAKGAYPLTLAAINSATSIDDLLYDPALSLDEARYVARARAKAARDEALTSGFTFNGKTIQTRNQVDIDNINGAALRATNDPTFTTGWICADNSILGLNAAGVIAMQAAMISRGNSIFTAYVILAGQIAACTSIAEVEALPPLNV